MTIDVHVIKSGRSYFDECIRSLEDEPINVHIVPYNENYGQARINGFSKGSSPYVAHVDDDDILVSGVFDRALNALKKGYSAYYSNHYVMDRENNVYGKWFDNLKPAKGFAQARQMHHVVVYRRDIIEPVLQYLDGIKCRDKLLLNLKSIHDGAVFGDSFMGLYWRIHGGNMHYNVRKEDNPQHWKDQVEQYKYKLLQRSSQK